MDAVLPPYRPNEFDRSAMESHEWKGENNRYIATEKEFGRNINKFFDVFLPKIGANLNGRINENFQLFSQVSSSYLDSILSIVAMPTESIYN
jgi:hypothetical protein